MSLSFGLDECCWDRVSGSGLLRCCALWFLWLVDVVLVLDGTCVWFVNCLVEGLLRLVLVWLSLIWLVACHDGFLGWVDCEFVLVVCRMFLVCSAGWVLDVFWGGRMVWGAGFDLGVLLVWDALAVCGLGFGYCV